MSTDAPAFDVVVVGCGIAGLSAAVTAAEAGASVAVLERAPKEERGGNTRYTESFWRMKDKDTVSDDFYDRLGENAGGHLDPEVVKDAGRPAAEWPRLLRAHPFADPELIAAWGEGAGPALRWLEGFGVTFDFLPNYFITQSTTRLAPVGGGRALVEALANRAEAMPERITFFYDTAARGLLRDAASGRVHGVAAVAPGHRTLALHGRAVVLASGGFEGNPEMLSRYAGPATQWIRPVARGGYHNRGEGIRMALEIGAAPAGDYGSFHAQPVDPRSGEQEPVVLNYTYGILVNRAGERFTDEAPATVDATYEATTREILKQPEGIAWAILDARLDDVPNWRKAVRTDRPPVEAPSLIELAGKLGIDGAALVRTVARYNLACPPGGRFDPLRADGLATIGAAPRKSNWARPLDRPPFRAWPVICANCFTFGGLKVDARARVLDLDGDPIPGLYAAGETMGVFFRTYTGSTSVMRGAVFGRIAGAEAAARRNTDQPHA